MSKKDLDTLFLRDLNFNFNDIFFSKESGLKLKKVFLEKGESMLLASFNNDKLNKNKWLFDIIESKFSFNDFISSDKSDHFVAFSGKVPC